MDSIWPINIFLSPLNGTVGLFSFKSKLKDRILRTMATINRYKLDFVARPFQKYLNARTFPYLRKRISSILC